MKAFAPVPAIVAVILAVPAQAGCNSGSVGKTALLSSVGCQADASGDRGTAVGFGAKALGAFSTGLGEVAWAIGDTSLAVGYGAGSDQAVIGSTSVGTISVAAGDFATALGRAAKALGG